MTTPFYKVSGYMTPTDALMGKKATRRTIALYWIKRAYRKINFAKR